MRLTWEDGPLPGHVGARLVRPTPDLVHALAIEASRPGAVLPETAAHYVTWLRGRPREREQAVTDYLPTEGSIDLGAPWSLALVIAVDGAPVGAQRLTSAENWPDGRTAFTSGWLLHPWQRRGLGTASRRAVLGFAFERCGAVKARSHALVENTGSRQVSERLGYRVFKEQTFHEDGRDLVEVVYELLAENWRPATS